MTAVAFHPFPEAVEDVSRGNPKLPQSEFHDVGSLPVVDQGQRLIAGYTDDESLRCRVDGPLIVFGDHTRAFKFVNFPFVIGADGVKVLRVRDGWDPKYVYHYLTSHGVPSAGYSRHFKFLKEIDVPRPPLDEQRRVAAILDQADALRAKRRQALAYIDTLAYATFRDSFGDPAVNPSGLPISPLKDWIDLGRPITYGILKPGPDIPGGTPYVRVADMQQRRIQLANIRRTTTEIATEYKRSTLKPGDLLMSIRGHVGRFAFVPDELKGANITQDSARLAVTDPDAAVYVRAAMESPSLQRWMARRTKGAAVQGINLGDLRELPLPVPPPGEMKRFAEVICRVEVMKAAVSASLDADDELFASLQSRAFAGEL